MFRPACLSLALFTLTFPVLLCAEDSRYVRETVVTNASDPVQVEVQADGTLYFLELTGGFKRRDAASGMVSVCGRIPVHVEGDTGCLGFALAPDFAESGHFYVLYTPAAEARELRVSRFTLSEGTFALTTEVPVVRIPLEQSVIPNHCGGGMAFTADGCLLVGVGDNSPPQDVPAVHPVETARDSRRSAGNSQDLRGKILRIRPRPDGTYEIPSGNMFADNRQGRPEVYAMGVRNPFRLWSDPRTGAVVWGDVGGNVDPALNLGPEGYDELNVTTTPGFFGWPFSSGPGAPWRPFDGRTQKPAGEFYDPAHPVNDSPANTGLRELPAARPALVWYPTSPSPEWPQLGSGGRSVTGGPVYHFDPAAAFPGRLPESLDGCILWGDWMRNWLALARLRPDGSLAGVERFLPDMIFRKPACLHLAPDGSLYVVEYGDSWHANANGAISRITWQRGNRAPQAVATADRLYGAAPLAVTLDAASSHDPDGDTLTYSWDFGGGETAAGVQVAHTFPDKGNFPVTLTVRDPQGAEAHTVLTVSAGNTPPRVSLAVQPESGFFEWGRPVGWTVTADDAEEGALPSEQLAVQVAVRDQARSVDEALTWPGLGLMRAGTCFACHRTAEASAGPPYQEVAKRYTGNAAARETLAAKILAGGSGVWGPAPMPPHPQHTLAQTRQMVDWILSLDGRRVQRIPGGTGTLTLPAPDRSWGLFANGVAVLTASAADHGAGGAPALTGEATAILRTRRQRAVFCDASQRMIPQDNLSDYVARVQSGGWISFDAIPLAAVRRVQILAWPVTAGPLTVALRRERADGPVLASETVTAVLKEKPERLTISLPLEPTPSGTSPAPVFLTVTSVENPDAALDITFVDFLDP